MDKFNYEYKTINTRFIVSDPTYQRTIDFNRVRKIVKLYNPNLVNPIKVSYRDGRYYCFDGQHTVQVLIARNSDKHLDVECKVYYGMTQKDEAILFAEQNGEKAKNVTKSERLNALYAAHDVDVIGMKEAIESAGFICDFKNFCGNNRVACYSTLYSIYIKYGGDHLKEVLEIIMKAWNGISESVTKEIVIGVDIFTRKYEEVYVENALVKRLQKVSPLTIKRDAKAALTGGMNRYARQILRCYNKNNSHPLSDEF